jgi:DNA-binding transcriptional MerR regulator
MKTVKEVRELTGISARALHHYDAIGLLKPTDVTEAGYRLYDDAALERLYMILVFRELGLSLKEIAHVLDAPDYDRNRVLDQQIALMQEKVTHLQTRIGFAKSIKQVGVRYVDFNGFNGKQLDDYSAQAKTLYGNTDAYREFSEKSKNRTKEQTNALGQQVMDFFVRLGAMESKDPASPEAQAWVKELQAYFTEHFYTCTLPILKSLGQSYAGGGSMQENIDAAGGPGTGAFAKAAIDIYCGEDFL